jgi:hypothetical protein
MQSTSSTIILDTDGCPALFRQWLESQCPATSSRCRRRIVSGVTMVACTSSILRARILPLTARRRRQDMSLQLFAARLHIFTLRHASVKLTCSVASSRHIAFSVGSSGSSGASPARACRPRDQAFDLHACDSESPAVGHRTTRAAFLPELFPGFGGINLRESHSSRVN